MEQPDEPSVIIEMMKWCSNLVKGREARRRRVPVLFDEFRDIVNNHTPIITVTGTSGKGTTCAMLEAVLAAGGHRAGVFTKPHLHSFRERISVEGKWVSNTQLAEHAEQVFARLGEFVEKYGPDYRPSFFEALLLVSASVFRQCGVTIAVYEAGVGGANDATSFLPAVYSVITSVDLDHQNELGTTIDEIATDKAGIAPPGAVLVVGAGVSDRARSVVNSVCTRRGVRCVQADAGAFEVISSEVRGQTVRGAGHTLRVPLPGSHQVLNCATVWAVTQLLHECRHIDSLDAIRGVERTRIPGRFELVSGSPTWLLDVAHNVVSIEALISTASHYIPPDRRVVILGVTEPHDYRTIVRLMCEWGVLVGVCEGFTRAIPAGRLAAEVPPQTRFVGQFGSPAEAIDYLSAAGEYQGMTVLVTGSLLLVGQWRHELARRGFLAGDVL